MRFVLDADAGERNERVYWAAKKAGEMVNAREIAEQLAVDVLTDAALATGLIPREIKGTIESGLRKGPVAA